MQSLLACPGQWTERGQESLPKRLGSSGQLCSLLALRQGNKGLRALVPGQTQLWKLYPQPRSPLGDQRVLGARSLVALAATSSCSFHSVAATLWAPGAPDGEAGGPGLVCSPSSGVL